MLINVIVDGETYFENGVPSVRGGKPAIMESAELEYRHVIKDNDHEHSEAHEYWLEGQLVHRSAHTTLKRAMFAGFGDVGVFQ